MGSTILPFRPTEAHLAKKAKRDALSAFRARLVAEIEERIAVLDALDGDPDFEPSLGWSTTMATGGTLDLEEGVVQP